jgi:heme-degrading monooxygenase HmoA
VGASVGAWPQATRGPEPEARAVDGDAPVGEQRRRESERGENVAVITEHAVLDVVPGRAPEFEAAFTTAIPIIASSSGFKSLRLARCVEQPDRYLLLVEWDSLSDHTEGFRGSPGYEEWRRLLHRFYDPFPTVEHFRTVVER